MATKSKPIKFATAARAARIVSRFGWENCTIEQLNNIMEKQSPWTLRDSANLGRIASALESLARALGRRK